ncbi:hypothetical protein [Streptomyces sp. NPDC057557]|uniref:hypothetical protein n=1 Tax=Streptomyces sp. NPDC057557 TaxID=3346167 RepID=UPI0036D050D3
MTQLALEQPAAAAPSRPAAGAGPLVVGLDLALSITGVAGPGWTDHIRTGKLSGAERLHTIASTAATFYRRADLVVLEGAAFSRALQRGHDELAALRWLVRIDLWRRKIPFAVVPPDNRTIYATGKARWKGETPRQVKGRVRDAVAERYGVECAGAARYDEADAYVLVTMGRAWLGHPLAEVPPTHARALAGVLWPDQPVPSAR